MSKAKSPSRFRTGAQGACEATVFIFFSTPDADSTEAEVQRVAATTLVEAVTYMQARHREFPIRRVESLGLVEMISGSPFD